MMKFLIALTAAIALAGCKKSNISPILAIGSDSTVTITWTSQYTDPDYYNIYYSTIEGAASEGQKITEIYESSNKIGTLIHTDLENGETYYYVVTVVGLDGVETQPSAEVSAMPTTTPDAAVMGRYLPIGDNGEIVRDIGTGLEWQRCKVGQTWNGDELACDGEYSTYAWSDAANLTAPGGFRTPSIQELQTLIYCSSGLQFSFGKTLCDSDSQYPTIVEDVFPNGESGRVWSSTKVPLLMPPSSYNVIFGSGTYDAVSYNITPFSVRLVRSVQ